MIAVLSHQIRDDRKKKVLSYDNMCHLNNLRVAKKIHYLYRVIFNKDKLLSSVVLTTDRKNDKGYPHPIQ